VVDLNLLNLNLLNLNLLTVTYLFLNHSQLRLDDRGRFAMATDHFDQLRGDAAEANVIVSLGVRNQLEIWPVEGFSAKLARLKAKADEDQSFLPSLVKLSSMSKQGVVDKQRRVSLPLELRTKAGIDPSTEVMVYGAFDHVEVWTPEAFESFIARAERDV
jgi:MraZ protein